MRAGTRLPRCVVLQLCMAVRGTDTARSPLCPSHRHQIFASMDHSRMTVQVILRCQRSKLKASRKRQGKRNHFRDIAAYSKWDSSLRCVTKSVAIFVSPFDDGDSGQRNMSTVQCKAWGISFATPKQQDEVLEGPTLSTADLRPR
ncbi:hypothetical protein EDB84DRAFT_912862 [Lactarius hengduanensis]|nr:hypothetical protein EDB84DRAFT_912862 [Lactarius hengduanensis]